MPPRKPSEYGTSELGINRLNPLVIAPFEYWKPDAEIY